MMNSKSPSPLIALLAFVFGFVTSRATGDVTRPPICSSPTHCASVSASPPGKRPSALVCVTPAAEAVTRARVLIASKDYVRARDALLVAMRLDPAEHDVLDAALQFVAAVRGDAAARENAELDELASDLLHRAGDLVAYQPLARVDAARDAVRRLEEQVEAPRRSSAPSPAPDPALTLSDGVTRKLEAAAREDVADDVRAHLIQEVNAELLAHGAAAAVNEPRAEQPYWRVWHALHERNTRLAKELENSLKRRAIHELATRIGDWVRIAATLRGEVSTLPPAEAHAKEQALASHLTASAELLQQAGAPGIDEVAALDDRTVLARLQPAVTHLRRTIEWNYNRWAVSVAEQLRGDTSLTPPMRLKELAAIDRTRLGEWALQRVEELWAKQFEECDNEQKTVAAMQRIFGEFVR